MRHFKYLRRPAKTTESIRKPQTTGTPHTYLVEAQDCIQRSHRGSETSQMHWPYAITLTVFETAQKRQQKQQKLLAYPKQAEATEPTYWHRDIVYRHGRRLGKRYRSIEICTHMQSDENNLKSAEITSKNVRLHQMGLRMQNSPVGHEIAMSKHPWTMEMC